MSKVIRISDYSVQLLKDIDCLLDKLSPANDFHYHVPDSIIIEEALVRLKEMYCYDLKKEGD